MRACQDLLAGFVGIGLEKSVGVTVRDSYHLSIPYTNPPFLLPYNTSHHPSHIPHPLSSPIPGQPHYFFVSLAHFC